MGDMDYIKVLQGVSLFSRLNSKQLKAIHKACIERSFKPGETLMEQGNAGVGLFIILEGIVQVKKKLNDGTEIEVAKNGTGEVIGEMSVLDGATRTASIIAETAVKCLVLSSWSFKAILEAHPEVALGILPVVVQRFRETSTVLVELRASRAES